MFSRLSPKRGTSQIGTFGLGLRAVLGVSDAPEFFSRSGSFRFDHARSDEQVRTVVSDAALCPVLRMPEPIDPADCWGQDSVLRDLMAWAVNIVRLPLRPGARDDLRQQMEAFPRQSMDPSKVSGCCRWLAARRLKPAPTTAAPYTTKSRSLMFFEICTRNRSDRVHLVG